MDKEDKKFIGWLIVFSAIVGIVFFFASMWCYENECLFKNKDSDLKSQLSLYQNKVFESVPNRCLKWGEWEYNNNSKSKSCLRIINMKDIKCDVIEESPCNLKAICGEDNRKVYFSYFGNGSESCDYQISDIENKTGCEVQR